MKKEAVKSFADLEALASTDAEADVQSNTDDDLVFEGGELDGVRTTQRKFKDENPVVDDKAGDAREELPEIVVKETAPKALSETVEPEVKAAEATETTVAAAAESDGAAGDDEAKVAEYKPNFAYKVYDQEKQFPAWAQKACVDTETETQLRTTLQKSEAFDTLKPKHESIVRERDEARGHVEEHVTKVNRMAKLRDSNVDLFLRNMGVSDKAIVEHAVRLIQAEDDPVAARALADQRTRDESNYNQELQIQQQQQGSNNAFQVLHQEAMQQVITSPDVVSFQQRLDAVAGAGSFNKAFALVGSAAHESEGYIPPREVARRVMEHYGSQLPVIPGVAPVAAGGMPVIPQGQTNIAQPAVVAPVVPRKTERPKTIPNVGRGGSASPVRLKPKNLDDMQKRIDAELDAIG